MGVIVNPEVYFTSDTHFSSWRTLELSRRPFRNIDEMDEVLIENWNRLIRKDDVVFHLGDFGNYEMIKYLNGKIHLVIGNYERDDIDNRFRGNERVFTKYLTDLGFSSIWVSGECYYTDDKMEKIKLVHKPSGHDKNCFNLFGHVHGLSKVKRFGLNVGVDAHHFFPVSRMEVMWYKNANKNHYDEEVFY